MQERVWTYKRVIEIFGAVCCVRWKSSGNPQDQYHGTGVVVERRNEKLILTCYHNFLSPVEREKKRNVSLRDISARVTAATIFFEASGKTIEGGGNELVACSRCHFDSKISLDAMDFVLLKAPNGTLDDIVPLETNHLAEAASEVSIIHYPQMNHDFKFEAMGHSLRLENGISTVHDLFLLHNVWTSTGSSGAPCFSRDLNLIGLHRYQGGNVKSAVLLKSIYDSCYFENSELYCLYHLMELDGAKLHIDVYMLKTAPQTLSALRGTAVNISPEVSQYKFLDQNGCEVDGNEKENSLKAPVVANARRFIFLKKK